MCHPAAFAVMGGLQAGAQILGQQQQAQMQFQAAKQQAEMQRRLNRQAIEAAQERAGRAVGGEQIGLQQRLEAINTEIRNLGLKSKAAIARETVAAGEAGAIVGQSQTAVINEYMAQEADMRKAFLRQQEAERLATEQRITDIGLGLSQFEFERDPRRILEPMKPRGFGIQDVLSIGSGAASGYITGREMFPGGGGSSITNPLGTTRRASGRLTIQGQKGDYVLF